MRSTLLSLLATTAAAATSNATWHMDASNDAGGICSYFDGILPSYCECKDANLGGTLNCTISMGVAGYHIDTISVVGNVLPCSTPASLSIVVYEYDLGFSYTLGSIKAGEEWHEPVRLLSLSLLSLFISISVSIVCVCVCVCCVLFLFLFLLLVLILVLVLVLSLSLTPRGSLSCVVLGTWFDVRLRRRWLRSGRWRLHGR